MAEGRKMTVDERLDYLDGNISTLNTVVIPGIINKMSLETRQTLSLFFKAMKAEVNPNAPFTFRKGATECLDNIAKLIATSEDS